MEIGELITEKPYINDKFKLIIDGNYFGMRLLFGEKLKFQDDNDYNKFFKSFCKSISRQIEDLRPIIDGIYFVKDSGSWRKQISTHKPKGFEGGYKENREKKEYDVDMKKYHKAYNDVLEFINQKMDIPVISYDKAEGDDAFYVLSRLFSFNKMKSLIWTSDGDASTVCNKYTAVFKLPKEKFLMNNEMFNYYSNLSTPINQFSGLNIKDTSLKLITEHTYERVNPYLDALCYIIEGQTKDNIPPIFTYTKYKRIPKTKEILECKARNGSVMKNKPTKKKVLSILGDRVIDRDFLYNENEIKKLISSLFDLFNQKEKIEKFYKQNKTDISESKLENYDIYNILDIEHTYKVFCSNRRLMLLDKAEIPREIVEGLLDNYKSQIKIKPDLDILSSYYNYNTKLPNDNPFFNSIKDLEEDKKFELEPQIINNTSLADDVLNSLM